MRRLIRKGLDRVVDRVLRDRPRPGSARRPTAPYHLLWADPAILFVKDWAFRQPDPPIHEVLEFLSPRPVHLFWSPSWHVEPHRMPSVAAEIREIGARFPGLSTTVIAPTAADLGRYRAAGLDAIHVNQNAFADSEAFDVDPGADKVHDAVYLARLARFKRHQLARRIPRLALVCASSPAYLATPYGKYLQRVLRGATWSGGAPGASGVMSAAEVASWINKSRVGLALSAVEGPMYASIEYLLCGVPVVSTPSRGGRHEFFDGGNSLIVDPEPAAVAAGVAELASAGLDPMQVRQRTLERMREHRTRLEDAVRRRVEDAGRTWDRDVLTGSFIAKLFPTDAIGSAAVSAHNRSLIERVERTQ